MYSIFFPFENVKKIEEGFYRRFHDGDVFYLLRIDGSFYAHFANNGGPVPITNFREGLEAEKIDPRDGNLEITPEEREFIESKLASLTAQNP